MNGGRSYMTIVSVLGFFCFTSVICQGNTRNCLEIEFYCPRTKSCDSLFTTAACDTSVCSGFRYYMYPCQDGVNCYSILDRCDTVKDCLNGADEMFCPSYSSPSHLKCLFSRTNPSCKSTTTTTTTTTTVRPSRCGAFDTECDGGQRCYSSSDHCDGIKDCHDGSDEKGCSQSCSRNSLNSCDDGNGCYSSSSLCDGVNDCTDYSDEKNCSTGITSRCTLFNFYCPKTDSCDSESSTACDTSLCSEFNNYPCEDGVNCFSKLDRCDTVKDCLNGADEMFCPSYKSPSSLKCLFSRTNPSCSSTNTTTVRSSRCGEFERECDEGRKCYSSSNRCDGIKDCRDGTDERACFHSCSRNSLNSCDDGNGCYNSRSLCDAVFDCADYSDENNCSTGGIPSGAVIGAIIGIVVVVCLLIGCKKMCTRDAPGSPQGVVAYHSTANYPAANSTFQSSYTYNNMASTQTGQVLPADGPYSPLPYPVAPYMPPTQYGGFPTTDHPPPSAPPESTQPPQSAPPPSYETLYPSK